jgi:hypothetical protein
VNSVVDIATCYMLEGRVFNHPWGRVLQDRTKTVSRPTQPPVCWIRELFLVSKAALSSHHFLVLGSRISATIPLPPICDAWLVTGILYFLCRSVGWPVASLAYTQENRKKDTNTYMSQRGYFI